MDLSRPQGIRLFLPVAGAYAWNGGDTAFFDISNVGYVTLQALARSGVLTKAISTTGANIGEGTRWWKFRKFFVNPTPEPFVNMVVGEYARLWTANVVNIAVLGGWPLTSETREALPKYDYVFVPTVEYDLMAGIETSAVVPPSMLAGVLRHTVGLVSR